MKRSLLIFILLVIVLFPLKSFANSSDSTLSYFIPELKNEINEFCLKEGLPPKYETDTEEVFQ